MGSAPAAPFLVVGVGASAGGLDALTRFFEHMRAEPGCAFVIVTHQPTGGAGLLPELLSRHVALPVRVAATGMQLEPDCVYVSPPGAKLALHDETFEVLDCEASASRFPIDFFFRSLAADLRERAVGIILSGSGSDGTAGLKQIKAMSGMVMVQAEDSAQYGGMPHSAIATDLADFVLPVEALPEQLAAFTQGRYPQGIELQGSPVVEQILVLLHEQTGHAFSDYKRSTICRRIERRMGVFSIASAQAYLDYLQTHEDEVEALFRELLIGVTSFFRDPEAFAALGEALEQHLASLPPSQTVRVWVAGCSTGEEAYSLAILLRECLGRLGAPPRDVQIFASDLDARAIGLARAGTYPAGIAQDVSAERLARYFYGEGDGYRVKKDIRDMIVFAEHNLISDPPFTKLDLLSCRNLLIYFDAVLQKRLLPIFHYAIRGTGLLFLGTSEAIGPYGHLFEVVDRRYKVFKRALVTAGSYQAAFPALSRAALGSPQAAHEVRVDLPRLSEKLLLERLVPPSVIVREGGDVVHIHGRTGRYLEPAPGPQTHVNVFSMAREGLEVRLAAAIRRAAAQPGEPVVRERVRVRENGGFALVDLRVELLTQPEPLRGLFLVTFEEPLAPGAAERESAPVDRVDDLERELHLSRQNHQGTVEELETTNEELKSTNEELQSTNEELQSANEELETSKEELQSLNEELQTVNAELQGKLDELARANDDMKNLLDGTEIATVFLDDDLRIKRFTEQARQVIRLIPSDVGRPIGDLVRRFHYDRLEDDAREVLRSLVLKEVEVRGEGACYLLRILPYRTTENLIDGLVITFVDVTNLRRLEERDLLVQGALRDTAVCVCGQDQDLRYTWVSSAELLGRPPGQVIGKTDAELFPPVEAEALTALKRRVLETGEPARESRSLSIGGRSQQMSVHVRPLWDSEERAGVACVYTRLADPAQGGGP